MEVWKPWDWKWRYRSGNSSWGKYKFHFECKHIFIDSLLLFFVVGSTVYSKTSSILKAEFGFFGYHSMINLSVVEVCCLVLEMTKTIKY